jgi:hypothetical protein
MDIVCPRCGEPWDPDSLHEAYDEEAGEPISYEEAARNFPRLGCGTMTGRTLFTCAPDPTSPLALMAAAVMELSPHPDDWASDLDDLRYLEGI